MSRGRGVFFLASDNVLDNTLAFLNSFREYNPEIPLCLVPFNTNVATITSLAPAYEFSIFENTSNLAVCDDMSRLVHGRCLGHYRKLAIWDGNFEEFIYIDVDTIVLSKLAPLFALLGDYDVITATSDHPSALRFVWRVPPDGLLPPEAIRFSANTGFFISRKGPLTLSSMYKRIHEALTLRPYLEINCMEQALLNYFIVHSDLKYSSLRVLAQSERFRSLPQEVWGADLEDHEMTTDLSSRLGISPLMVHWAGLSSTGACQRSSLWTYYRGQNWNHAPSTNRVTVRKDNYQWNAASDCSSLL
jgi:hypothetical protein